MIKLKEIREKLTKPDGVLVDGGVGNEAIWMSMKDAFNDKKCFLDEALKKARIELEKDDHEAAREMMKQSKSPKKE